MIPLKDHNPSGKTPFVTYFLIGINILVFLFMFPMGETELTLFFDRFALIPSLVTSGEGLYTFLTSMFLHGGLAHLLGNLLFLNIFGDNLEDFFGHLGFLVLYIFCGLVASLLQILASPSSSIPMVGASGAIAGVMGGYLVLFPRHQIDILFSFGLTLRRATVPAYTMLFYWFIFQLFSGVGSLAYVSQDIGGVAYLAHVGGFVSGWLGTKTAQKLLRRRLI
jgi:membrane associated rhomboid family serine protease